MRLTAFASAATLARRRRRCRRHGLPLLKVYRAHLVGGTDHDFGHLYPHQLVVKNRLLLLSRWWCTRTQEIDSREERRVFTSLRHKAIGPCCRMRKPNLQCVPSPASPGQRTPQRRCCACCCRRRRRALVVHARVVLLVLLWLPPLLLPNQLLPPPPLPQKIQFAASMKAAPERTGERVHGRGGAPRSRETTADFSQQGRAAATAVRPIHDRAAVSAGRNKKRRRSKGRPRLVQPWK